MSLQILLVDDHAIVRQGIRQLLIDRGIAREVVEAECGGEALAIVEKGEFDVVLLDISLPDMNGIEVLKRLKRRLPRTPVLMFSMYREDQFAVRALKAGAAGYLSKTVNAAQMVSAISQVAAGRKYVSPAMAEALAEYVLHGLKIVSAAVVAQAVWGMARNLCPDARRVTIMTAATGVALVVPSTWTQLAVIASAACIGLLHVDPARGGAHDPLPISLGRRAGACCLALFVALLAGLPLAACASGSHALAIVDACARRPSWIAPRIFAMRRHIAASSSSHCARSAGVVSTCATIFAPYVGGLL